MSVQVECPVCEHRYGVSKTENPEKGTTTCRLCGNKFAIKGNELKPNQPTTQIKTSPQQQSSAKNSASSQPAQSQATVPVAKAIPDESSVEIARATKARALLKRRRSPVVPIILGLCVVASAVALIVVFIQVDPFKEPVTKNDDSILINEDEEAGLEEGELKEGQVSIAENSPEKNEPRDDGKSVFRTSGKSDEVEEPPVNAPPDKPPKNANLQYFNSKQIKDFWADHNALFVRLKVDNGVESRYVPGTIVDARGWVVTSLSAVTGAKEIEVQNASSNLRAFNGVLLESTDLVRGVIAMDRKHDLVLLSINRMLVVSLADVKFGKTNMLVGGRNFVQCSCPGTKNYAWPKEIQVEERKKFDDLDFDFQSQIEELQYDKDLDYVITQGYSDTSSGAGVFSIEGEMIGMHTGINDGSRSIIMTPAEAIEKLIASSSDSTMNLSVLEKPTDP